MNRILLIFTVAIGLTFNAKAQKGNNQLQVSGQLSIPTSDLADVAKLGFGAAAKGMYGFGKNKQQATLEVGYNRFSVKNLPSNIDGYYSAIPIYTGYRYTLGRFNLEPQAGISINRVGISADGVSLSSNKTNFAWATSVGYSFNSLELGLKYQSSEVKDSDANLTFVAVRLAYNFTL